MSRVAAVIRREYLERVRSKSFIISTILAPLLMGGLMLGPSLLFQKSGAKPVRLAVLDAGGTLRGELEQALAPQDPKEPRRFILEPAQSGPIAEAKPALERRLMRNELDAFVVLPADIFLRSEAEYYGRNVTNFADIGTLDRALREIVVARRLADAGFDPARVKDVTRGLDLKRIRVTAQGAREDKGQTFFLSMLLLTMLYASVLMWGAAIMTAVLEEKTSRVVEVVVSSLSPWTLFAGKLAGVAAAGMTQFLAWAACLALFGLYGATVVGSGALPEVSVLVVVALIVYFVLGFLLYGSMYAAVGAAVNTAQEAQNLAFPVMMPLILGFVFFPVVMRSPDSTLSTALSLVPLFAPLLMFLRITSVTPPAWQLALSVALMLVAIAGVTWGAARIYRVGILMYGKKPTFPEMLRWLRQSSR